MPTYEYACEKCATHIEIVQSFKDKPPKKCAHCGGPLRKVFHPVGIVLKGSGFYKTDSRPKKGETAEPASSSAAPSSSSESATSSAKPTDKAADAKSSRKGEPKKKESA